MVSANRSAYDPPVRIHALGRFYVTTPGAPDGVQTRSRSKPLELLKLLAAHGGEGLAVQQVMDALWPDAEGDRAQWAFSTTLRRLRGLVDGNALQLHSAQLSLCWEHCWLDVRALSEKLAMCDEAMDAGAVQRADQLLHEAFRLYQGPLLAGESDAALVIDARERLHSQLLRHVQRLGDLLQNAGDDERAIDLYRSILEIDPAVEWLYQALLRTLTRAGRHSEGIAVYERCRRMLASSLDATPSAETEALQQALLNTLAVLPVWNELPSIAVMPFESPPGAESDQYFATGLADDIQFALSKISGLTVFAHGSTDVLWSQGATSQRVAEVLGARYVATGSVRRLGPRVRVTVSIVEGQTGKQVCGDRFDRAAEDLYLIQDEIVDQIVTTLRVKLVEGEQVRFWRKSLRSPRARDCFYLGLAQMWRKSPESLSLAREHFSEVIRLAPEAPHGHAYMAWCYLFDLLHCPSADVPAAKERAEWHALKAMEIDPHSATVHSVLGHVKLLNGDGDAAIAHGTEAIRQRPGCSVSHAFFAMSLLFLDRPLEAITQVRAAIRLCPMYPPWYGELLGWAYLFTGNYEQASAAAQGTLRGEPECAGAQLILATAFHGQGRNREASQAIDRLREWHSGFDIAAFVARKPAQGPRLLGRALAWLERAQGSGPCAAG